VAAIVPATGFNETDILRLAATVERRANTRWPTPSCERPRSAISISARSRNSTRNGKGATGKVDGKTIVLGNANFPAVARHRNRRAQRTGERLRGDGATAITSPSTASSQACSPSPTP